MLKKLTIEDIDVNNKRILVRVDFNVPIQDGVIQDDTRIKAALPTIEYLVEREAKVVLCSHLGRPNGVYDPKYSLIPVASRLAKLLKKPVKFTDDCIGEKAVKSSSTLLPGEVLLLENTRFHDGEKKNDSAFAAELAKHGEIFINDAFGTAHRSHASNVGVASILPSAAGFLLIKEIEYLDKVIAKPERPFTAILGGAKISDKIGVIESLLDKADNIIIGGGIANTFFSAQGYKLGDSLVEEDSIPFAREILQKGGHRLRLPVDVVIAKEFSNDAKKKTIQMQSVPDGWRILDIGRETIKRFSRSLSKSKTIVWNGPMGVFEMPSFAVGTFELAKAVAKSEAISIIGGGDSASAIMQSGLANEVSHISTGGGASLEMLEGKILPGLAALNDLEED